MQNTVLGLLAETFVHPGSGRSAGAIDLPVAREAATDYPYIAGSGMKGALRDFARQQNMEKNDQEDLFGKPDAAGKILVSDARLLLLPVRSLTSSYKWVTSRHLIERLARDLRRCGRDTGLFFDDPGPKTVLGKGEGTIYLEERNFTIAGEVPAAVQEMIGALIPHPEAKDRLSDQLVVLSDSDFAWFARYGLAVQARNVLDETTKESKNLWYEETLPPDTLMYCILAERMEGSLSRAESLFTKRPFLQAGGNETVGQGWFAVSTLGEEVNHG